jgi:hypothetical protein
MIQKSNTLIDDLYRQYWKSIYGVFFSFERIYEERCLENSRWI